MDRVKSQIQTYWDWRSQSYGLDQDTCPDTEGVWAEILSKITGRGRGRKALDIGTGTGQFAFYLTGNGFSVTGLDLSDMMIQTARNTAAQRGMDIDFQTGDAENTLFEDQAFDLVVSRNLLWTLPDPGRALGEWYRILKPGGIIILSDGAWQNHTWKRIHNLTADLVKTLFTRAAGITLRFFTRYLFLQQKLPFYEGIGQKDAHDLIEEAGFCKISSVDVNCFSKNPYGKGQSFFILHANK